MVYMCNSMSHVTIVMNFYCICWFIYSMCKSLLIFGLCGLKMAYCKKKYMPTHTLTVATGGI